MNTPNNPLGKIYTKEELEFLSDLCKKHNVIVASDEVYEHITYDREHIRIGDFLVLVLFVFEIKLILILKT
jgi:aspartate/methionine/tyrosine aminotransferase